MTPRERDLAKLRRLRLLSRPGRPRLSDATVLEILERLRGKPEPEFDPWAWGSPLNSIVIR